MPVSYTHLDVYKRQSLGCLVVAEIDKLYPYFSTSFFATVPFPTPENPEITSNEPLFSMIFPFLSYSMF